MKKAVSTSSSVSEYDYICFLASRQFYLQDVVVCTYLFSKVNVCVFV